jgi:hypothetical protein
MLFGNGYNIENFGEIEEYEDLHSDEILIIDWMNPSKAL